MNPSLVKIVILVAIHISKPKLLRFSDFVLCRNLCWLLEKPATKESFNPLVRLYPPLPLALSSTLGGGSPSGLEAFLKMDNLW